jgi:transposase-like protein
MACGIYYIPKIDPGTSLRDISAHIKETYDTKISATTLSAIRDKVIPLVKEWQQNED